jgi:hypothetical protein
MNQQRAFDEKPTVGKPKVWGIAIFGILRCVLSVFQSSTTMNELDQISPSRIPGWLMPALYLGLALAVVTLVAAILIWRYKRLGLQLGLVVSPFRN